MSEHDGWRARRETQYDRLHDAYDRTVLVVGGGALALSVTFASAITGTDPINIWKLGSAWIALVTSVAFVALSYIPSIRSHWLVLSNRDAGWWATAATGLSVGSGLLLAVGLGMLGWFAIDNMTGVVT